MTEERETVTPASGDIAPARRWVRFLVAVARFVLVLLLGVAVAGVSFYLLRKFGY
jgi:hypothetical protein